MATNPDEMGVAESCCLAASGLVKEKALSPAPATVHEDAAAPVDGAEQPPYSDCAVVTCGGPAMTTPGATSRPFFELRNCGDLFKKAKQDFSELDKQVNSYDLFNFLCTTNHISDWVLNDPQISQAAQRDAEKLKTNPKVAVVRQLCNHAKHLQAKSPTTRVQSGYGSGRYGVGPYGVGEPSYEVDVDGQMVHVLDLGRDVLAEWEKLLTKHRLL